VTQYMPIPKSEQSAVLTYPVVWRCWCGAPAFGIYDLSSPQDDPRRVAITTAAMAHRASHKAHRG